MTAREIMTENPACCTPDDTVQHAAKLMVEHDCGCVPVVDDIETRHLVGVGTDRDLACRCLGEGKGADTRVSEVMIGQPELLHPGFGRSGGRGHHGHASGPARPGDR